MSDMDSRISEVWNEVEQVKTDVSGIKSDVASVKTDISHISSQVTQVGNAVDRLANTVSSSSRTDWKMLASWAGIVMTILIYHGEMKLAPGIVHDNHQDSEILKISTKLDKHIELESHPAASIKFKNLEQNYLDTKDDIQTQIRRLQEAFKNDLRAMNEIHQKEIDHLIQLIDQIQE